MNGKDFTFDGYTFTAATSHLTLLSKIFKLTLLINELLLIKTYVCVCVYVYVCMYVCMYVCLYGISLYFLCCILTGSQVKNAARSVYV